MDYDRAQIKVREQELFSKIYKIRDREKEELDVLRNQSLSDVAIEQIEDIENLIKCYDALINTRPRTMEELDEIEWVFNKGRLRSQSAIEKREKEKAALHNSKTMDRIFMFDSFSDSCGDTLLPLIGILTPIIPWKICLDTYTGTLYYGVEDFMIKFVIFNIFSCIFHLFALWGLWYVFENFLSKSSNKLREKAGLKKKSRLGLGISAGIYTASLLYTIRCFKRKR